MSFEQDIKNLRLDKKMTQQELADIIHVSRQTISAWENGKNYPGLDVLRELSNLFVVSFEKIIFGEESMTEKQKSIADTIDRDVALKARYKKATIGLVSIVVLLLLWVVMLTIGYQKGIDKIDRFNPFLQYTVGYTKMPSQQLVNPNNPKNGGYWTRWFSDNDMGTEWTKLTLTTGLNPGIKDPYVMVYHKGSYVKIARIVPGSSVNKVMKSNVSAITRLAYSKNHDNLSLNMSTTGALKNKSHFNKAIQELVVE
ncbi:MULTISPECIES: helix-turn-helix transcriptional regulator [Leuconostoc]|uniref:XRE family transcriptional regulator n=1 Tax=Leuconostoc kimchii TaxID=136609 RepID=A0ABX5SL07_9LACO|nr:MULTISPECIES: helix-turn-helix transcriptional regulator [Leuconostoc]AEJ31708.1 XRE family transcriptional regulator [Leuconostoc sp. C2]QBR46850.1 XRE family transcriptional regulator [Leuconostoc kimchii]